MAKTGTQRRFIPAAGHDWLLPLYDPVQGLFGGDAARRTLVEQAAVRAGQRVLDLGCGTGSLSLEIARAVPGAELLALDPDPKALARARRKCEGAGASVAFERGFSDELPYADASLDRVLSSFVLHHLSTDEKRRTLAEVRRVLRPGGSLHVLDFGSAPGEPDGWLARLLHSAEHLREHLAGRIPELLREAGFADARELAHRRTLFGRIAYYRGSAAGGG